MIKMITESETAILYSSIFKKNDAFCKGKGTETMICFPNIKINLGLRVINRRTDGFHTIESVFFPVNFCDMLEVVVDKTALPGTIHFTSTGLPIAGNPDDNLICKAYQLLHAQYNLPGVHIHLHK